jgi:hypothetical protein
MKGTNYLDKLICRASPGFELLKSSTLPAELRQLYVITSLFVLNIS